MNNQNNNKNNQPHSDKHYSYLYIVYSYTVRISLGVCVNMCYFHGVLCIGNSTYYPLWFVGCICVVCVCTYVCMFRVHDTYAYACMYVCACHACTQHNDSYIPILNTNYNKSLCATLLNHCLFQFAYLPYGKYAN